MSQSPRTGGATDSVTDSVDEVRSRDALETTGRLPFNFKSLLYEMIEQGASDLHLTVAKRPVFRIDGRIEVSSVEASLEPEHTEILGRILLNERQWSRFEEERELDFSFAVEDLSRFRANVYRQRGCVALAIRAIPFEIRSFEELGLPETVPKLAEKPRGLVLVTGPTGSGKSTTLATMVDKVNRERKGHIVTIEDPIEFLHDHKNCIVNQREVGADTRSFSTALKYVLRQDPDVILVGEMRDLETIQAALTIAETGHLAFATLHTNSAAETVNRIIDVFPAHQQSQVRAQLAFTLEGVITQTLLPKKDGGGRVVACEILVCTPAVRSLIRDDKVHQIYSSMQAGKKHGMQTLNDSLYRLYVQDEVDFETCVTVSSDPNDFRRMVTGSASGQPEPGRRSTSTTSGWGSREEQRRRSDGGPGSGDGNRQGDRPGRSGWQQREGD